MVTKNDLEKINNLSKQLAVDQIQSLIYKTVFSIFLLIFLSPIIGVFTGALAGYLVGLVFTDSVMHSLNAFGVDTNNLTMWQLGAMLGFIGGFFRIFQKST